MSRRVGIAAASSALLLVSVLTVSPVAAAGFESPEDAVRAYLAAFSESDLDGMLDTMAIDELSEAHRFDLFAETTGVWHPALYGPSEYRFYADVHRYTRAADAAKTAELTAYELLAGLDFPDAAPDSVDQEWALEFIDQVDPAQLASLTVLDVRYPGSVSMTEGEYLAATADTARLWGSDAVTERVALVVLNEQLFTVPFRLVRYGDAWLVHEQSATLAAKSVSPTTVEEFDELTKPSP